MMERYFKFKGIQPHINIDKIEAEIAFLSGTPEMALEIAEKSSSYEKVTEQRLLRIKANMAVENTIRAAVGAVNYIRSS
jgi:uridine phosphorylase